METSHQQCAHVMYILCMIPIQLYVMYDTHTSSYSTITSMGFSSRGILSPHTLPMEQNSKEPHKTSVLMITMNNHIMYTIWLKFEGGNLFWIIRRNLIFPKIKM